MSRKSKANETRITLDTLTEIGACIEARRAFVENFGKDGAPTAKEVFHALAKEKRYDWLFWLASNLNGFVQAVGNDDDGDFHCRIEGEFELNAGFMISSGSAIVEAYGRATVRAYGSATVQAYGSATVRAYDSATVMLDHFSLRVTFSIKSLMACVVDRRNGARPIVILAEPETETQPE